MRTRWSGTAGAILVLVATLTAGVSARAQEQKPTRSDSEHVMRLTPAELTWTAGPPMLPAGASMAEPRKLLRSIVPPGVCR